MDEAKNKFLEYTNVSDEVSALQRCLVAAFRRNKIYKNGTPQIQRKILRDNLRDELQILSKRYMEGAVSEADHEANIVYLSDEMSKNHSMILAHNRFNIGTSQKALNVYLKFLLVSWSITSRTCSLSAGQNYTYQSFHQRFLDNAG